MIHLHIHMYEPKKNAEEHYLDHKAGAFSAIDFSNSEKTCLL